MEGRLWRRPEAARSCLLRSSRIILSSALSLLLRSSRYNFQADMQVREKILVLLDSWQEAFGGPRGKYRQYYWAYEELRRSGVEFPKRSLDASPIFTPPASHPTLGRPQPGYGMPSNASRRLDETMATEIETLSLSSIEAMRNVLELLGDMLQAVNPSDCTAIKDEVIVELVNRCCANQKKLMQMLTSTGNKHRYACPHTLHWGWYKMGGSHNHRLSMWQGQGTFC